jgi:hypothetical protein
MDIINVPKISIRMIANIRVGWFSDARGFNPDLNSFIIYVFPKDKNKLWNSQQNGGFIINYF